MKAKKSLGQHFLYARAYLERIADAAGLKKGDLVLEIGPGTGSLTGVLLEKGARVVAIEKDHRLISLLQEKFKKEISEKRFFVAEGDFLLLSIPEIFRMASASVPHQFRVVGNIPYYITGSILRKILSEAPRPREAVFLVQKEVAERIARSVKESILSLSVKAYGTPKLIQKVPRGAFSPAPKVDSAILSISDISAGNFATAKQEKTYFELLHAGFGQKRKLLRRNIEKVVGEDTVAVFEKLGIPQNARAEDVPLQTWLKLSEL